MFCNENTPRHIYVVVTCQIISKWSYLTATVMQVICENRMVEVWNNSFKQQGWIFLGHQLALDNGI